MHHFTKWSLAAVAAVAMMGTSSIAIAASDCGEIILGSAISFTGKYSTNGIHAKNGYDLGAKKIKCGRPCKFIRNAG